MAERRRFIVGSGSVRFRVTSLAGVLFAIVLAASSVALVVTLRQLRVAGVEDNLRIRADDLQSQVESGDSVSPGSLASVPSTVAQVVGPDGVVVAASHESVATEPMAEAPALESLASTTDLAVDDDRFLVLSRRVGGGAIVHVAQSVDDIDEAQAILIATSAILVPAVTLVLVAAVWVLVGRTLQPVEAIRSEVAAIGAEHLDRRVPVPPGSDEVSRLALTMNEMLTRIEDVHTRQRQFTADASHELRSPLTRIRSELEVDLAHPGGADPRATHESVLEEVDVLQRTIDDLLLLARGGDGAATRRVVVDLDDLVLREVDGLRGGAVVLDVSAVSGAQVRGNDLELARAVRNLLDNAVRHATSRVVVTLGEHDGSAVLTVTDDGAGIAPADQVRIFERFTRLEQARSRHGSGAGLGLAITREIIARHRGTVALEPSAGSGARFVMTIPLNL